MNIVSLLKNLLAGILFFLLCSCGGNDIPPAVIEPEDEVPADNDKVVLPDGPYEYDDDMSHDTEAFLASYKGSAYKGPHSVPGTLEAEDFDEGPAGAAYYESDTKPAHDGYRGAHQVDVRASGNASGGYYIGDVQPGEWMSYTVEAEEDGEYAVDVYVVKGDGSEGSFTFEVDGRGATASVSMPLGGWEDFSHYVTAEGIQLSAGKHVIRYCATSPGNVDRFVFRRTGEMQDISSSVEYPLTAVMSNPLFVDFPSPMYNSWLTGHLYTADASAHVWNIDGREVLYVYASHDMEPSVGCDRMDRYHVFSTEDMKSWTDHGEIMNAATVRKQAGWGSDGFMWAPDCAYNPSDGLYYFYFPHPSDTQNWNRTWRIGVAVSRYPDKEFHVVGYVEGMPPAIDPCVFVDDDGQPYIYNGGGGTCYGARLRKDNWMKLDGGVSEMKGLTDFHEATWIHKYNGRYYLSHSDNNSPSNGGNRMRYAVSDSPLGPWESLGVYMYPQGVETNHGSIVKFKGQWYAFYHTADFSGNGTLRSVCVDPLTVNEDGTLEVVNNWGTPRGGLMPALTAEGSLVMEAEDYNDGGWFTRARQEPACVTSDGRTLVEGLESGSWLRYSFRCESSRSCSVSCSFKGSEGSRVLISINGEHPASDGISVGNTGVVKVEGLAAPEGECCLELRVVSGSVSVDKLTIE